MQSGMVSWDVEETHIMRLFGYAMSWRALQGNRPWMYPLPHPKTKIRRGHSPRRIVLAAGSCPAVVIAACADDFYFLMTFAVLTVLPSALTTLTM